MDKGNKKQINLSKSSQDSVVYEFPKSEEIFIDKSNFQILLSKFKDRIKSSFSLYDLLAVISLWAPLFSADFKSLFKISSDSIKSGYFVFALIITVLIIYQRLILILFGDKSISSDPEKTAQKVLEQCKKKNKQW